MTRRSLISNNGTAAEDISAFLGFHLQGLIPKIPHILEETQDFLSRIEELGNIPMDSILVTFYAVGSYPSIPHDEAIENI